MAMVNLSSLSKDALIGKNVLVRVDYNVPLKDSLILDDARLRATLPTLDILLKAGATPLLLSHFGRPKGQKVVSLSLSFLKEPLERLTQRPVLFCPDFNPNTLAALRQQDPSALVLFENLRFEAGEEANDPHFAATLSALGDFYVNDAYSVSHRAHASVEGITAFLPSYAGCLFEQEHHLITQSLLAPKHPLVAVIAGSKVSTKLALIENLLTKADHLILGGGIANTFLKAQGFNVGTSLVEEGMLQIASHILEQATRHNCTLHLPIDVAYAPDLNSPEAAGTALLKDLPSNTMILDIGPQTLQAYGDLLKQCATLVWNGPLGVFEVPPFDQGTLGLAKIAGELTSQGRLTSIAGGGETAAALKQAGVLDQLSGLSLSGGAFLEALEGKILPGVAALEKAPIEQQNNQARQG